MLILFGKGNAPSLDEGGLDFNELFFDYTNLPPLQTFTARDGKALAYRHYPAQADKVFILVHGSGWHSQYFLPLAEFLYLTAIEFNMPESARDGTETLSYSHRLNTAYAPRNYKKDLSAITQPLLVVAGTADDAFIAEQFEPVISQYTAAQVTLLPGVTHMGVVVTSAVQPVLKDWLQGAGK